VALKPGEGGEENENELVMMTPTTPVEVWINEKPERLKDADGETTAEVLQIAHHTDTGPDTAENSILKTSRSRARSRSRSRSRSGSGGEKKSVSWRSPVAVVQMQGMCMGDGKRVGFPASATTNAKDESIIAALKAVSVSFRTPVTDDDSKTRVRRRKLRPDTPSVRREQTHAEGEPEANGDEEHFDSSPFTDSPDLISKEDTQKLHKIHTTLSSLRAQVKRRTDALKCLEETIESLRCSRSQALLPGDLVGVVEPFASCFTLQLSGAKVKVVVKTCEAIARIARCFTGSHFRTIALKVAPSLCYLTNATQRVVASSAKQCMSEIIDSFQHASMFHLVMRVALGGHNPKVKAACGRYMCMMMSSWRTDVLDSVTKSAIRFTPGSGSGSRQRWSRPGSSSGGSDSVRVETTLQDCICTFLRHKDLTVKDAGRFLFVEFFENWRKEGLALYKKLDDLSQKSILTEYPDMKSKLKLNSFEPRRSSSSRRPVTR